MLFDNDIFSHSMDGHSFLGSSGIGMFFRQMLSDISKAKRERQNKDAGVEQNEEMFYGVPSKNIPFNFYRIDFNGEHYVCLSISDEITLYDNKGNFLFTGVKFKNLQKNMYLVQLSNDDELYCLFRGFEQLSEPIYFDRDSYISKFKGDFCSLPFKDGDEEGQCIVDLNGDVVLEAIGVKYHFHDHYNLVNNIAHFGKTIYNLKNGEVICHTREWYKKFEADDNLIFVELSHPTEYGCDGKGVCKIDTMTCEFEIFGNVPKPRNPKPPPPTEEELEEVRIEAAKPRVVKQGRNDECQCGSGKKFKQCCTGKVGQILVMFGE